MVFMLASSVCNLLFTVDDQSHTLSRLCTSPTGHCSEGFLVYFPLALAMGFLLPENAFPEHVESGLFLKLSSDIILQTNPPLIFAAKYGLSPLISSLEMSPLYLGFYAFYSYYPSQLYFMQNCKIPRDRTFYSIHLFLFAYCSKLP